MDKVTYTTVDYVWYEWFCPLCEHSNEEPGDPPYDQAVECRWCEGHVILKKEKDYDEMHDL